MKLEEKIRTKLRRLGLAYRTEKSYIGWYKRYVKFHNFKHPKELGSQGIEDFLNDLAINKQVAAGTQNQALNALLFLYREVLDIDISKLYT